MALIDFNFVNSSGVWDIVASFAAICSTIATAVMAFFTWKSVKQGREQLVEMREQREDDKKKWEEENRPYLEITPILPYISNWGESLAIEIKNFGNKTAKHIKIEIDDNFIKGFQNDIISNHIRILCNREYRLLPNESKYLTLCHTRLFEDYEKTDNGLKMRPQGYIFGTRVDESAIRIIKEHLSIFSFDIKCTYEGHSFENTLSNTDIKYEQFNYLSYLKEISYNLSDIKDILNDNKNRNELCQRKQ